MNLNDKVSVTLNDRGAEIYNAYMTQFPEKIRRPAVESGHLLKTPLWDLFHIFGQHIHLGAIVPFEGCEIEIGKDCAVQQPATVETL